MLNENAQKWIETLRSGKYKQGRSVLRTSQTEETYCCLGVACELAVEAGVIDTPTKGAFCYSYIVDDYKHTAGLPDRVAKWLGVNEDSGLGDYISDGRSTALAYRNDDGVPFKEIADLIESEPEGLFTK